MKDTVFTTFKVWDSYKGKRLSKKEVLALAHEHLLDIQKTFDLDSDSYVRQTDITIGKEVNVYTFEIRYLSNLILIH